MLDSRFVRRMKEICEDYAQLELCFSQPAIRGIRINPLKLSGEKVGMLGLNLESVPFSKYGYKLNDDIKAGASPWHHAGAFYSQEPSAMSAVTALDPQPGERVLDMCAAPGGKSTQIAGALGGRGLLWSNEVVRSRAQILVSNIERLGVRNAIVSSARPDVLAERFEGWFDRVLVDAPCSGEGMFRHDPQAVREWSPEHVEACAVRQAAILDSACRCVGDGGVLVYSTCTFSPEENELTILSFLQRHEEYSIEPIEAEFGRPALSVSDRFDLSLARRIYPMDGGEGHFVARLRKSGQSRNVPCCDARYSDQYGLNQWMLCEPWGESRQIGDYIYILPGDIPETGGMSVIRAGVPACEVRSGRLEPTHALFMSLRGEQCASFLNLTPDSETLKAFLHGEQLTVPEDMRGFTAVGCAGVVTGFGKCSGGCLKNRYPKGLRTH